MTKIIFPVVLLCIMSSLNAQEKDSVSIDREKDSIFDSTKSNYTADIKIGNPTNKDVEMAMDDFKAPYYRYKIVYTKPWFDFKKKLNEETGIQYTLNYSAVFMGASTRISDENQQNAASGIFDATIKWDFINRKGKNKGSLILWLDSRHLYYGDVTPQFLNFDTGSALFPALQFNKWTFRMLEFYYQQVLFNRIAIVVGKIDLPDWFNFNTLLHPKKHFTDFAFSVNPTVSWSNPGFGIVAGGWVDNNKQFGVIAGLNDVAGHNLASDEFFNLGLDQWSNGKFLKMVEVFYTPARARQYFNRISATIWHSDELLESDESFFTSPRSKGFSIQTSWVFEDKFIPVVTFGLSDGNGANSMSKLNLSLAHAWFFNTYDMLGMGINYTQSIVSGTEAQLLGEVFYRFTFSKTTMITPTVKLVINPALNPNVNVLFYYGIRIRISV
jgi:porin